MSTCCPWDEMGVATLSNRFANVDNTINFYSSKDEVVEIGDGSLKVRPFFRDFRDRGIYGEDGSAFVRTNAFVRWYALSHGIPAESFAAGANPVPKWDFSSSTTEAHTDDDEDKDNDNSSFARNVNMATDCNSAGPGAAPLNWIHSYFIQLSLRDTRVTCQRPWVTDRYYLRNSVDGSLSPITVSELKSRFGVTDDEILIARMTYVDALVPYSDFIALPVPAGVRNCCPCPEHHTDGVSLAYARRVSVVDPTGSAFRSSEEDVLCCGQGEDIDPLQREYAWYNQERLKGTI